MAGTNTVIASAATQFLSIGARDCFVAALLAMTAKLMNPLA
ncbi:hypothetical protein ABTH30_22875 [Acinetobacter baumannii]